MGNDLVQWVSPAVTLVTIGIAWGLLRGLVKSLSVGLDEVKLAVRAFQATVATVATLEAVITHLKGECDRQREATNQLRDLVQIYGLKVARIEAMLEAEERN